LLKVDLDDTQLALLTVGQPATAQFENVGSAAPMSAKIVALTPAAPDGSSEARATVQVNWGDVPTPNSGHS